MNSRLSRALDGLPIWVAAAGFLFTSAAYGWFQRTGTPLLGMDAPWLIAIVHVEFLAIHSFPFLMIIVMGRPELPQFEGVRLLGLGLLFLMYLAGAHSLAGWPGVGLFASLAAITYLGFFVNLDEGIRKFPELGLRWLCNMILLMTLVGWFELPSDAASWSIADGILPVGGLYFLGVAGLELSGLYQKPFLLDAGRGVSERSARVGDRISRPSDLQASHSDLYWMAVPILGSAALNFLPLLLAGYVAGVGARFIDARVEWPRSANIEQWWFPGVMALFLLAARCYQICRLTTGRTRNRILAALVASYLLVAVMRYRADPTYHFAYALIPGDAYTGFLLLEIPLLFFLVPATWWILAFPRQVTRELDPRRPRQSAGLTGRPMTR